MGNFKNRDREAEGAEREFSPHPTPHTLLLPRTSCLEPPNIMTTHFVTAEIDFQETPAQMHFQIEAQLRSIGEPLRWAIVNIDMQRQKAIVEAVVTLASDTLARL